MATVQKASPQQIGHVMAMWEECFGESQKYMDLYFGQKYLPGNCYVCMEGDKMVSSLQVLPYGMRIRGMDCESGYLSGVATGKSHQKKGYMSLLMKETLNDMKKRGWEMATLIPASHWLFDLYGKSGFSTVFHLERCMVVDVPHEGFLLKEINQLEGENMEFYRQWLESHATVVKKTRQDMNTVCEEHRMWGGRIFAVYHQEKLCAIAFSIVMEGKVVIKELATYGPQWKEMAAAILERYQAEEGILYLADQGKPLGMARAVDIPALCRMVAKKYPQLSGEFYLKDDLIDSNSGHYIFQKGSCTMIPGDLKEEGETPEMFTRWVMMGGTLADITLPKEEPYMNLMLN